MTTGGAAAEKSPTTARLKMKNPLILFGTLLLILPLPSFAQSSSGFTNREVDRRPLSSLRIGYTECQTNLRGGRHANIATMRACVVNADGTGRRALAGELTKAPDTWTKFVMPAEGGALRPITQVASGHAAIFPNWQPPAPARTNHNSG